MSLVIQSRLRSPIVNWLADLQLLLSSECCFSRWYIKVNIVPVRY
jgi:hypothetical protein